MEDRRKSGVWCGGTNSTRRLAGSCCQSCTWVETEAAAPALLLISAWRGCQAAPGHALACPGGKAWANPAQRPPG